MNTKMNRIIIVIFIILKVVSSYQFRSFKCELPSSWSGGWSSRIYTKDSSPNNNNTLNNLINRNQFLSKGFCTDNKDERYLFYNRNEKCYRCLFVIQKHYNILQFRETHCDENVKRLDELCNYLSPDLPLITLIRENAMTERCPLRDSYKLMIENDKDASPFNSFDSSPSFYHSFNSLSTTKTNSKCNNKDKVNSNLITKCPDETMLRLDLNDCDISNDIDSFLVKRQTSSENERIKRFINAKHHHHRHNHRYFSRQKKQINDDYNGLLSHCIAHWSEGSINYLMIKEEKKQSPHQHHHRCLVFKDLDQPFKDTNTNNNLLNPKNNLVQLSLSDDEMCRDLTFATNGLNSFVLNKVDINESKDRETMNTCKFPRLLNKKWRNLDQTNFAINLNSNMLHISPTNQNSMNNFNFKLNCIDLLHNTTTTTTTTAATKNNNKEKEEISKKDHYIYLVNNLLDW
jgi:hypothetical protein